MSYYRLSWFTLSFIEWWDRLRKSTCHLPVFLLCVPISLLASKCLVRQSPIPGIVIHFRRTIPPQLSPKSPLCAYPLPKGSKFLQKLPLKNAEFKKDMRLSSLKKCKRRKNKEEVPMILSKNNAKEEFNKMTPKTFPKCESISPSPLNICDSIRSEFDQVSTSCEPLFGLAIQVIKVCHTLPT